MTVSDSPLPYIPSDEYSQYVCSWENYFMNARHAMLLDIVDGFPETKSLYLKFADIDTYDPALASSVLENPTAVLSAGVAYIKDQYPLSFTSKDELHIRVTSLPNDAKVPIRDIRTHHLNSLLSVEGIIRKATVVKPCFTTSIYRCRICGHQITVEQDDARKYTDPIECPKDEGGCGKAGPRNFQLIYESSDFIDTRKIEIQEAPDNLHGNQPASIIAYLDDDIVGDVTAGDRVTLNGILRAEHRSQSQTPQCDLYLDVVSIEKQQDGYEEVEITQEDVEEIRRVSQTPALYDDFVSSVSPTIYGYEVEKLALILQLFGGVTKVQDDGARLRGDIHILLIGDPGVAKSQLLKYISKLSPRGIYTSGKGSTSAGLTATAVKDEFGEGRWTLEAGALVLADQGNACIDELDKMRDEDRSSMHEAMESQTISIAKAGLTAQLHSRCSVLGAANPKFGRFEDAIPYVDQIDLSPTLLSRFDLIFTLADKPEESRDMRTSQHILQAHMRGSAMQQKSYDNDGIAEILSTTEALKPMYDREFLRKYIAYAKTVTPLLTQASLDVIQDAYMRIRSQAYGTDASVPITARQLEAYVRLAEASARARLSETVTEDDAKRAVYLVEYYLKKLTGHDGMLDIDSIATGVSKQKRDENIIVLDIIKKLDCRTFTDDDVLEHALKHRIPSNKLSQILKEFCKTKEIRSLGDGTYERL